MQIITTNKLTKPVSTPAIVIGWPNLEQITKKWDGFFESVGMPKFSDEIRSHILSESFKLGGGINGSDPFEVSILYAAIYATFEPKFKYPIESINGVVAPSYFENVFEKLKHEFPDSKIIPIIYEKWKESKHVNEFIRKLILYEDLEINEHLIKYAFSQKPNTLITPYDLKNQVLIEALLNGIDPKLEIGDPSERNIGYPAPKLTL